MATDGHRRGGIQKNPHNEVPQKWAIVHFLMLTSPPLIPSSSDHRRVQQGDLILKLNVSRGVPGVISIFVIEDYHRTVGDFWVGSPFGSSFHSTPDLEEPQGFYAIWWCGEVDKWAMGLWDGPTSSFTHCLCSSPVHILFICLSRYQGRVSFN